MNAKQPREVAQYLKGRKNVLVLAGALCDTLELNGRKLIDYAADVGKKLGCPVAATGNTVRGLRERGIVKTKKMWIAELLEFMRGTWRDEYLRREDTQERKLISMMPDRPDTLVFIGYDPTTTNWLISGMPNVETVALTPTPVARATCCLPVTASFRQWQRLLDELVESL